MAQAPARWVKAVATGDGIDAVLRVKHVSRETQERLTIFHTLLVQWQKRINLIASSTVNVAWTRHFADSIQMVDHIRDANHVVDLGSGAGFPGLIFGILMAESGSGRVDLIESAGKKCAFLRAVARETGLADAGVSVQVHHNRIEQVLPILPQPDIVSARALAGLGPLLDLSSAPMQNGSIGLFPKGREYQAEIDKARLTWDFDVEITPSVVESDSVILTVKNLRAKG